MLEKFEVPINVIDTILTIWIFSYLSLKIIYFVMIEIPFGFGWMIIEVIFDFRFWDYWRILPMLLKWCLFDCFYF